MAESFIGLSVLATLNDPHGAQIRGVVTDVEAGQLTLSKGETVDDSECMCIHLLTCTQ